MNLGREQLVGGGLNLFNRVRKGKSQFPGVHMDDNNI